MVPILERVKNMLLSPQSTWDEIKAETTTIGQLFQNYLFILAGIPAVAGFIGWLFNGENFFLSFIWGILHYIFSLVAVWAASQLLVLLAPNFQCEVKADEAFALYSYSITPLFLVSIFMIIPGISFLLLFGIYGFFLLYVGITKLVAPPIEKTTIFTIAAALIISILYIVGLGLAMNFSGMPDLLP